MAAATGSGTTNAATAVINNQPSQSGAKNQPPRVMKTLSENKLKRLNILTYINDKKEILFTKKAYKYEKERIWREIFLKMRDSGMVSPEKDWRYVRDVSFSNWRKRAQKRLKHLAANGIRINMDECEFLISDILGHTPDRKTCRAIIAKNGNNVENSAKNAIVANMKPDEEMMMDDDAEGEEDEDEDEEDEESDEDMIDSDEEDIFDQMLLVPKVVINDDVSERNTAGRLNSNMIGKMMMPKAPNGCLNGKPTIKKIPDLESSNKSSSTSTVTIHRLEQLEIENRILKNRYMKLKIFMLEKNLGLNHCPEVKDLD